jgi:putative N6-adenine-specific DNA methylase
MYSLFLICPRGLEEVLALEVADIAKRIHSPSLKAHEQTSGGVTASGDWRDVMALNLWSRIASRVMLRVNAGEYRDERDVYDIARRVRWQDWFTPEQMLRVDVTAQRSHLRSLQFATLTVKDAVCDAMRESTGARPSIDTALPDVRVLAHLTATHCTVYLDTSGEPLFKRGWRNERDSKGEAPIKENLAAGLVQLMALHGGYDGTQPLIDPFCGSGTLVIEAAQWLAGIAPQSKARAGRFGFERLSEHGKEAQAEWRELQHTSKSNNQLAHIISPSASDISGSIIEIARRDAAAAGVNHITFSVGNVLHIKAPATAADATSAGFMIANPPYGERMQVQGEQGTHPDAHAAQVLFKAFGQRLKTDFQGWQVWIITGDNALPKQLGFSPKRKVPLYNGAIETRFFGFDLVRGVYRPRAGGNNAPLADDCANSVT